MDYREFVVSNIIKWGEKNKDSFPWRKPPSIFHSAVAEIMLIRTPPMQVLHLYKKFMEKYPKPQILCSARIEDIENDIKVLGLKWRAKKLHDMACYISKKTGLPVKHRELSKVPGIGNYIASAIITFYFKKRTVMIDSNTVRFLTRFFGKQYTGEPRKNKQVNKDIQNLVPEDDSLAVNFNVSLLDFMRKICMSNNPKCSICVLKKYCSYFTHKKYYSGVN